MLRFGRKQQNFVKQLSFNNKKKSKNKQTNKQKGCLLLERKAMTNLDSVLKSRDTTLLTKVSIVNAMVFPVVKYRCECWTIRKAEP